MRMVNGVVLGYGKNNDRPIPVAQRNFVREAMRMDMLAAWGQGIKRQFMGFSSMLERWERRMRKRYNKLKEVWI